MAEKKDPKMIFAELLSNITETVAWTEFLSSISKLVQPGETNIKGRLIYLYLTVLRDNIAEMPAEEQKELLNLLPEEIDVNPLVRGEHLTTATVLNNLGELDVDGKIFSALLSLVCFTNRLGIEIVLSDGVVSLDANRDIDDKKAGNQSPAGGKSPKNAAKKKSEKTVGKSGAQLSPKMKLVAEAFQKGHPGPEGESLAQALARSLRGRKLTEWKSLIIAVGGNPKDPDFYSWPKHKLVVPHMEAEQEKKGADKDKVSPELVALTRERLKEVCEDGFSAKAVERLITDTGYKLLIAKLSCDATKASIDAVVHELRKEEQLAGSDSNGEQSFDRIELLRRCLTIKFGKDYGFEKLTFDKMDEISQKEYDGNNKRLEEDKDLDTTREDWGKLQIQLKGEEKEAKINDVAQRQEGAGQPDSSEEDNVIKAIDAAEPPVVK
ncbi:MAG: hypothetical protein V1838_04595 [Patescibacteria group bacterium]